MAMQYMHHYDSPLGRLLLRADNIGLTELGLEDQGADHKEEENLAIQETKRWLDVYFSGREPNFLPPLHPVGTAFQMEVWELLLAIPYGKTTTYGQIAKQIAGHRGIPKMSAQAVGGAVGRNKIGIIIPCHRVIGTDGNLTGYAAGLERKRKLLALEGLRGI